MLKRRAAFVPPRRISGFKRPRQTAAAAAAGRARFIAARNIRTGGFVGRFRDPLVEKKFSDANVAADAFTTVWAAGEMNPGVGSINCLSGVAQGDGESQRDGRVYNIHSIHIKGFINLNSVEASLTPLADVVARLALVWDTQTNQAQLEAENVFLTIGAAQDIDSFRNLQFSHRFIVLKDKMFTIKRPNMAQGSIDLFATHQVKIPFKMNKVFTKPIKVRTSGTTANVNVITDNSLHLIGTASLADALLTYQVRMRFTG